MSNFLKAISNICSNPATELKSHYSGRNTMNNMGEALETFIQDAFSDSINEQDPHKRKQNISNTFSYLGNQNNPPDMIVLCPLGSLFVHYSLSTVLLNYFHKDY